MANRCHLQTTGAEGIQQNHVAGLWWTWPPPKEHGYHTEPLLFSSFSLLPSSFSFPSRQHRFWELFPVAASTTNKWQKKTNIIKGWNRYVLETQTLGIISSTLSLPKLSNVQSFFVCCFQTFVLLFVEVNSVFCIVTQSRAALWTVFLLWETLFCFLFL